MTKCPVWVRATGRAAVVGLAVGILPGAAVGQQSSPAQGSHAEFPVLSQQQLGTALRSMASEPRHVLVDCVRPITQAERDALGRAGLKLTSSLGGTRYVGTPAAWLDADRIVQSGIVRSIGSLAGRHKLHRDLTAGRILDWMVVESADAVGRRLRDEGKDDADIAAMQIEATVAVYVQFHGDVEPLGGGFDAVVLHGGEVVSLVDAVNALVVHLPQSRIVDLAGDDRVLWIEPPLPALTPNNDSVRSRLGIGTVASPPYGLDGSGVSVMVYDGGNTWPHADFDSRLVRGDMGAYHEHPTHVSGIIAGSGLESNGQYRGVAPGVTILSYEFQVAGDLRPGFLYTDPGDMQADYEDAIHALGADISNNSIGSNVESNGYDCAWQGNYGVTSSLIDSIVWGALGEPFRVVWSGGNERQGERCNVEGYGDYYSVGPPNGAKNHISVGALNSNDDSVTTFTSWGPMDDGRLKPDLSGPGCQSTADLGVTSTDQGGGYSTHCGTSMSAPAVCGVAALLIQQWRQSMPGEPDPRNATLKAILANSAADIVTAGPDYQSGYGSVRALPAVDTVIENRVMQSTVGTGQVVAFTTIVTPGEPTLRVTMAWDDFPAIPLAQAALVNDLDLRVIGPDGSVHLPWTLNPLNPAAPAVRTAADRINNIEQVQIDAPVAGAYRIEVSGFNVAWTASQDFGLASSAELLLCTQAGSLVLDTDRYPCTSSVHVMLNDCDLDTNANLFDQATILVRSDSEPFGEIFTVTERGVSAGVFEVGIPISTTDAAGVLRVSDGDAIVVEYVDADDGQGGIDIPLLASAVVDCTPPVLLATDAIDVQGQSAVIHIETDEPASVRVWYGTECGDLASSGSENGLDLAHNVLLEGLSEATAYFYGVETTDQTGNTSFHDGAGQCYSFETPDVPDYFTQFFESGESLEGKTITFYPDTHAIDHYTACFGYLDGALPVDPALGSVISHMNATETYMVWLPPGVTFRIYGEEYDRLGVNSAGGVEFGTAGGYSSSPALAQQFSSPRVSVWWGDFASYNQDDDDTFLSYKLLPDRFVASWVEYRQYDNEDLRNTFQVEIFNDGRIRMSWLRLDTDGTLVGLSAGGGVPDDFYESDLLTLGSCPPAPPVVHDVQVTSGAGSPVTIRAYAEDDGLPAGTLSTRIESLPAYGTLDDPVDGARVLAVPYDLLGDSVVYTPLGAFRGEDSFEYSASDGGASPDGGDSQPAAMRFHVGGRMPVAEWLTEEQTGLQGASRWDIRPPDGQGSFNGDPLGTYYGLYAYVSESRDYPPNLAPQYIRTPELDLTGRTGVVLRFQEWLAIEGGGLDRASIEGTLDDVNWFPVWEYDGPSVSPTEWSLREHDLSWFADNQPHVRVRWVMGPTNDTVEYPGWTLDEIQILAVPPPGGCQADFNNDGAIDFFDAQRFLSAFSAEEPTADFVPDGDYDFFDIQTFLNQFSAGCP